MAEQANEAATNGATPDEKRGGPTLHLIDISTEGAGEPCNQERRRQ